MIYIAKIVNLFLAFFNKELVKDLKIIMTDKDQPGRPYELGIQAWQIKQLPDKAFLQAAAKWRQRHDKVL